MKSTTLVFYERDPMPARLLAVELRTGANLVGVREAHRFMGEEREVCDRVIVMPDVTKECVEELHRLFPDKVEVFGSTHPATPPEPVKEEEPIVEEPRVPERRKGRRVVATS